MEYSLVWLRRAVSDTIKRPENENAAKKTRSRENSVRTNKRIPTPEPQLPDNTHTMPAIDTDAERGISTGRGQDSLQSNVTLPPSPAVGSHETERDLLASPAEYQGSVYSAYKNDSRSSIPKMSKPAKASADYQGSLHSAYKNDSRSTIPKLSNPTKDLTPIRGSNTLKSDEKSARSLKRKKNSNRISIYKMREEQELKRSEKIIWKLTILIYTLPTLIFVTVLVYASSVYNQMTTEEAFQDKENRLSSQYDIIADLQLYLRIVQFSWLQYYAYTTPPEW
eukprot:CAMPEP_0114494600 /NCGR_PEP_ID=MMETSP0109-20121206/4742_1 /TAXON_ID=29199 /ORGANISM="Chlorarachnion reptans, Strain CCCM449" /LENGTH=279 /DNA_ID=CAMNT_0001671655 /DNA_START=457 /DNA_END=1293 /DNA_ORIENTATION=+